MRHRSALAASAAILAVSSVLAHFGPSRSLVEGSSAAIGDATRPYVLATPFYHPKNGTNATLHFTNMDDVSLSLNMRRYDAVGGLLSSTLLTVQKKSTVIAFAGANSGAQMHLEIWSPSPFFTMELFFTDTASNQQHLPYSEMMKPRAGTGFNALSPFRVCDTRKAGPNCPTGSIGPNGEMTVQVTGVGGTPTGGVDAVTVNLVATGGTLASYLTVWPDGTAKPLASTLNFAPGQTVANMVTVKVGSNGKLRVSNAAGQVHVVADLAGYFA